MRNLMRAAALLVLMVAPGALFGQFADLYKQAADRYREAAAQCTGVQQQLYLQCARYHDCLAQSMYGGPSCGNQGCSMTGSGGPGSASFGGGLGGGAGSGSGGLIIPPYGGSASGRSAMAQQLISQGFGILQNILASRARRAAQEQAMREQDEQARQRALEQWRQFQEELERQRAQLEAAKLQMEADRLIASGDALLSGADQLLQDADKLLDSANSSPDDAFAKAHGDRCKSWGDEEFTVTAWGSDSLWLKADVLAWVVNQNGQPAFRGSNFLIKYGAYHKVPLYYGFSGVLNHALAPGAQETVAYPLVRYRSANETRPEEVTLRVRYCKD